MNLLGTFLPDWARFPIQKSSNFSFLLSDPVFQLMPSSRLKF
ncbi:uncharacterized protein METZ01_LOCUS400087, partial [marine metagenome]